MRVTSNFILRQLAKHGFECVYGGIAIYKNQSGYSVNTRITLDNGSFSRDKFYECARDIASKVGDYDFSICCTMSSEFQYATCNITLTKE